MSVRRELSRIAAAANAQWETIMLELYNTALTQLSRAANAGMVQAVVRVDPTKLEAARNVSELVSTNECVAVLVRLLEADGFDAQSSGAVVVVKWFPRQEAD